jgi:2Fe-2S ferredoxin
VVKVVFLEPDGTEKSVEVAPGSTLMEAAVFNMVDGIIGLCGGICSCATCHCYVDPEWRDRLAPPGDGEGEMIASLDNARPGSRLGCQVTLTPDLDGIRVQVPADQ